MEINQFHSGSAVGDAITNQMRDIRNMLRKEGYSSEIYADHIPDALSGEIQPILSYTGHDNNILLVHHSMGFDTFQHVIGRPDKKCLIYHNITPERFFTDSEVRKYIRKGLRQTKAYRRHVDYTISCSNFSRRELLQMGYSAVDIMPVQISLDRFNKVKEDKETARRFAQGKNILFVGRVAPNKHQDDIITAFAQYNRHFESNSRLLLVGDDSMGDYRNFLRKLCRKHGVEDKVLFLGKVSEEVLKACYMQADLFLCMSEHEGFGVPLLEAMALGVPVVAYASSAIPETMGGAGVLLQEKSDTFTAALMNEILMDKGLQESIVKRQAAHIARLKRTDTRGILLRAIENIQTGNRVKTIQMQGPFETSYSLAIVNRRLMESMDELSEDEISIYCTEGPGDYEPAPENLADKPHAAALWQCSKETAYPDVVLRNMYPPRVFDTNGGLNLQLFGWEETVIPQKYISDFNAHMDGIGTMSDFVTHSLQDCGARIRVETMGIGVELLDDFSAIPLYRPRHPRGTTFLHISSAFPRKGVDILLKAYYSAFTGEDDVCLILKTFPNPHNSVNTLLAQLNKAHNNPPMVEAIDRDMTARDLAGLYKVASCYVHVARGEGFGLPVAEAMLAEVPVIVSPNTGLADFCNEQTALLVDYVMEPARTHLSTEGSEWAHPNGETLEQLMYRFYADRSQLNIEGRVAAAKEMISTRYSWQAVTERWLSFIRKSAAHQYRPKVAIVGTWNTKCGIAEYTRFSWEHVRQWADITVFPNYGEELIREDEDFVERRMWHSAYMGNLDRLAGHLKDNYFDIVHIHFNYAFYQLQQLGRFIEELADEKAMVITFHKTGDAQVAGMPASLKTIVDKLNRCDALIVHQPSDKSYLQHIGVEENRIHVIPLGQMKYPQNGAHHLNRDTGSGHPLVLGSYGFLLPQKGILQVMRAVAMLKEQYPNIQYRVCCALHDSVESIDYYKECQRLVTELDLTDHVTFYTDYLTNEESMEILMGCDILAMPYLPVQESASGAVRFCVAAQRPLITTRQPIFDELADYSLQIEESDPAIIAKAVSSLMDEETYRSYLERLQMFIDKTSWDAVSETLYELYRMVDDNKVMEDSAKL